MAEGDPLGEMRSQVDAAYAAADRLVREAEAAARELLVALRALLDWWIARLERPPEGSVEVQDIPIE